MRLSRWRLMRWRRELLRICAKSPLWAGGSGASSAAWSSAGKIRVVCPETPLSGGWPSVAARRVEIEEAEAGLDIDGLVEQALGGMTKW